MKFRSFQTGSKLLILEPKAAREDYLNGEDYILLPLKNGKIYRHDHLPMDLYLQIKIGSNILQVRDVYLEKFPHNPMAKRIILHHMRQAVKRFGRDVFLGDQKDMLKHLQ